jgi:hypothetical protein
MKESVLTEIRLHLLFRQIPQKVNAALIECTTIDIIGDKVKALIKDPSGRDPRKTEFNVSILSRLNKGS